MRLLGDVGQIDVVQANLRNLPSLERALEGATVSLNLVGIGRETGRQGFQAVHAMGARNVAEAARTMGAARVVQMSALGADSASPSKYQRTKAEGEAAVRAIYPDATVVRPSVVFGNGDSFFNRFAAMAQLSPALPLIGGGQTRFQPVYVGDVADAFMAALARSEAAGQTYELGGPRVYSFKELMQYMLGVVRRRRALVTVPWGAARFQARLLELLPDPLLTRDQVELLRQDNVVSGNAPGLEALGIAPTPIEAVVPGYLRPYFGQGSVAPPAR
jgi:NADH dehydrogenase